MQKNKDVMQFSLNKDRKRSILKSRYFILIIGVILVFALTVGNVFTSNFTASDISFALFFLACLVITSLIFFGKQRAFSDFIVDEEGIKVKNKTVSWEKAVNYHWLGEAQDERIGIAGVGGAIKYDPINPNVFADTKVARVKIRKNFLLHAYVNLEVDSDKANDLKNVFEQHGVKHFPKWRQAVGI